MAKKVQTSKFVLFFYLCAKMKGCDFIVATNHTVTVLHHSEIISKKQNPNSQFNSFNIIFVKKN